MTSTLPQTTVLWGKRALETDVWTAALDRTRRAFDSFDHCFVSFSGGKDSTVVLNTALVVAEERGALPLRVVHFDEEAIPYETEHYVRRMASDPRIALEWWCLPLQQRNSCTREDSYWWCWGPEEEELWVRPMPPEALTFHDLPGFTMQPREDRPALPQAVGLLSPADKYGSVGMLMGIRADESFTRRKAVANARIENYVIPAPDSGPNLHKVYPIYDWATTDVWTAPAKFGWDYNRAYDMMELAGLGHHQQRCAPPYAEQPMKCLWTFKLCFPDLWERMVDRVPGASTGALYANTELYALQGVPDPKPGETWQEQIAQTIAQYPDPEVRNLIAHRLQGIIASHYRKTPDPILSVPHPISGVSWRYLCKIAMKGDFRSREWPEYGKDAPEAWEKYDAVRAVEAPA